MTIKRTQLERRSYETLQAAVFCKTTERFGGLSNMCAGFRLNVNGVEIRTVEALYQACRFPDFPEIQRLVIEEKSPMTAKMVSRKFLAKTREDWNQVRIRIMRWCLRVKLAQNYEDFSEILIETGELPIVEMSRKDQFWGAKLDGEYLFGYNVLGRLLMELRQEVLTKSVEELQTVVPPIVDRFMLCDRPVGIVMPVPKAVSNLEQIRLPVFEQ